MKKTLLFLSAVILLGSYTILHDVVYQVGNGPQVNFKAEKGVEGLFSDLSGTAHFVPAHLDHASFEFTLKSASINTGNGMKNKHAMGSDWLDASQFPSITFKSKSFSKDAAQFYVVGDLTLKGKTQELKIPFQWEKDTLKTQFDVNRKDFNIDGKGSNKVSEVIHLDLAIPMQRK